MAINPGVIQWLLAPDQPAVRYRTLVDLLGQPEDDPEVVDARRRLLDDPDVRAAVQILHSPSPRDSHVGFCLAFLAEVGVPELKEVVAPVEALFLQRASGEGSFVWKGKKMAACQNGLFITCLARLGYRDHPIVQSSLDWLARTQRPDSGWLCRRDPQLTSCPKAANDVLRALALFPEYRDRADLADGAVDFLLRHWETRARIPEIPGAEVPIKVYFFKLRFPLVHDYTLLSYARTLAHYLRARRSPVMTQVRQILREKQETDGRYRVESSNRNLPQFTFSPLGAPSRWLTWTALTILRQLEAGA